MDRPSIPFVVVAATLLLDVGCRKTSVENRPSPSRSAAPSSSVTESDVSPCAYTLAATPEPANFASFPVSAESGDEERINSWSSDHYSGGTFEASLDPFVVRFEKGGAGPGQCTSPAIREARCNGSTLRVSRLWPCGRLRLRRSGEDFVITYFPGGSEDVPLVSFRREKAP